MDTKRSFLVGLALLVPLAMFACGGGGGGGGGGDGDVGITLADMAGTWFGTWEDNLGDPHTIQMTIDSAGNMTDFEEDGGSLVGLTGTLVKEDDQVFGFELSDDSVGGLLVDGSATYAAYLDDFFYVGILQKGATALPTFERPDFNGSWDGYSVWVNSDVDVVNDGPTVINVNPDDSVIGTTLIGAIAATLYTWVPPGDPTYGIVYGEDADLSIFVEVFLSVDKQAAASYACPFMYSDFTECEFGGWLKR